MMMRSMLIVGLPNRDSCLRRDSKPTQAGIVQWAAAVKVPCMVALRGLVSTGVEGSLKKGRNLIQDYYC